ncbi:hypothetical protein NMY22_g5268 [Coprinellus aureogranulatus]|nr:hypothetical protein NMY22_g5268 [Coprinellus aureogranulatus]
MLEQGADFDGGNSIEEKTVGFPANGDAQPPNRVREGSQNRRGQEREGEEPGRRTRRQRLENRTSWSIGCQMTRPVVGGNDVE